ncbi:hypothetical protein FRE64_17045 (plasmid) [Euhalothece natronophila Z-M001]|uniref:Uncharacterized protein n=1 Tax=Euhalothece natronophila Z-M001 TaxID=522448 RepID=A0A5B8NQS1_9CHRO|nr:hypothetical protein [Euhalothece natronophila]QDZ41673.1 hypothetical protein FRE64_17045 [Euhalothece natronophila Z-M001]
MKFLNQRQFKHLLGLVLLATPLTLSVSAMSAEAATSSQVRDAIETDTNVKVEEESDKQAYHSPRRRGGRRFRRRPPKKWFY